MSEKMFKLSTDYQRLWTLLQDGATVVYQVVFQKMKKTGFIDKSMCPDISMSVRYTDEDGLKEWRDIEMPEFINECERLNLQFFDEIEPNLFWLGDDSDIDSRRAFDVTSDVLDCAEEVAVYCIGPDDPITQTIHCAVRVGLRKVRVWEDENGETKWGWAS